MKRLLAIVLMLASIACAVAKEDPCPALTKESMNGVWEAIDAGPMVSVFQMRISDHGESLLLVIWENGHSKALKLTSTRDVAGTIELTFAEDESSRATCGSEKAYTIAPRIVMKGQGFDCGPSYARFEASVTLAAHDQVAERVLALNFVRTNGSSVAEQLHLMSERGKMLSEAYLSSADHPTPPR